MARQCVSERSLDMRIMLELFLNRFCLALIFFMSRALSILVHTTVLDSSDSEDDTDILLDLQPANILFSADNATINDIQLQPPTFSSVKWLPGIEIDDSAPQYLVVSQRPRGILDSVDYRRLSVRIGDLGGGSTHFPACWLLCLLIILLLTSGLEWPTTRFSSRNSQRLTPS